jgi:hypothetical protein
MSSAVDTFIHPLGTIIYFEASKGKDALYEIDDCIFAACHNTWRK